MHLIMQGGDVTIEMIRGAWNRAMAANPAEAVCLGDPLTTDEAAGLLHSAAPAAIRNSLQPSQCPPVPLDKFIDAVLHHDSKERANLEVRVCL